MDAVEYLKEKSRLMNRCEIDCDDCRFYEIDCVHAVESDNPKKAVEIIEQWSKDCPVETYKSVFLKAFPKTNETFFTEDGNGCPMDIYKIQCPQCGCKGCWDQPYKED